MTDRTKRTVECIVNVGVYASVMTAGVVTTMKCMEAGHIGRAVICFTIIMIFSLVYALKKPWLT